MLDFSHLPNEGLSIQKFVTPSATGEWSTWTKPRGCKMFYLIVSAGGSGGSAGFGNTAGTARGGGGGGGGGAVSILMIPSIFIPDILYLNIGAGGKGGIGTNNGSVPGLATAGGNTTIALVSGTAQGAQMYLTATGGAVGATANAVTGATGGAGGTVSARTDMHLSGWGFLTASPGIIGGSGGVPTGSSGSTPNVTTLSALQSGGGGGGGLGTNNTDTTGGSVGNNTQFYFSGAQAVGQIASGGFIFQKYFHPIGGTGGGTNSAGKGINGGDSLYGTGGGGGGAGLTGGDGGKGGDGYIFIIGW